MQKTNDLFDGIHNFNSAARKLRQDFERIFCVPKSTDVIYVDIHGQATVVSTDKKANSFCTSKLQYSDPSRYQPFE